jgi:hypothetical protein
MSWWHLICRPSRRWREIGWEVFGPPRRQRLLARGDSKTFDDAKAAAEIAFGML